MKTYIGDGVYVEFDGYGLVVTTEDGIRVTNRIVLEPDVYNSLLQFHAKLVDQLAAEMPPPDPKLVPGENCPTCDGYILSKAEAPYCPSCAREFRKFVEVDEKQ